MNADLSSFLTVGNVKIQETFGKNREAGTSYCHYA